MNNLVKYFEPNYNGTDYIVSDIHGCYTMLDQQLEALNFDPTVDRLFSVGDLCDRGPESIRALEYLKQPWFFPVYGNHDSFIVEAHQMEVDSKNNPSFLSLGKELKVLHDVWSQIGGRWWQQITDSERYSLYQHIIQLPYINIVYTPNNQTIAIAHAEIPVYHSVDDVLNELNQQNRDVIKQDLIWSRDRILTNNKSIVEDVDRVYCGHTIIQRLETYYYWYPELQYASDQAPRTLQIPYVLGNHYFIDGGAYEKHFRTEDNPSLPYQLTILPIN